MPNPIKVLFLCTGNSCRSQMAEGLCQHFLAEIIEPFSAGIEQHGLNPLAVKVMQEIGIDISSHTSKTTAELNIQTFDYVITVCSHAHEHCPVFPALKKLIHCAFEDPPALAKHAKTETEALVYYRKVRDEIKEFVVYKLPNLLGIEPK